MFGLRTEPAIAVVRPESHGRTITMQSPWAWHDVVASWTWPGHEGAPVTVEVAADADEVALLLDGTEVARGPVGTDLPMLAALETVHRPGKLTAVAYRTGVEVGRSSLASASGPTVLTAAADRTTLRADDTDLAYVAIELRDAGGILVTGADVRVTVEVAGNGALAGLGSGNPRTTERFDATARTTFDGRALAIIRPSAPGDTEVTVAADGYEPVVLRLQAVAP